MRIQHSATLATADPIFTSPVNTPVSQFGLHGMRDPVDACDRWSILSSIGVPIPAGYSRLINSRPCQSIHGSLIAGYTSSP